LVSEEIVALLLTALFLLVSAATASAECAWVLWTTAYRMEGGRPVSEVIEPSSAYTKKGECDSVARIRDGREEERRKRDPSRERYFECFPDTVDPRGPKGR
jgi:hypothetical protein